MLCLPRVCRSVWFFYGQTLPSTGFVATCWEQIYLWQTEATLLLLSCHRVCVCVQECECVEVIGWSVVSTYLLFFFIRIIILSHWTWAQCGFEENILCDYILYIHEFLPYFMCAIEWTELWTFAISGLKLKYVISNKTIYSCIANVYLTILN